MHRIPAFLLSLLTRQLALAKDSFLKRYPNSWLIWEPGEHSVPVSGVDVSVAATQMPGGGAAQRPLAGDALCFALKVPEGTVLRVGRAAESEVLVSDLTVSRVHAQLTLQGGRWVLESLSETKATSVGGAPVSRGQLLALSSGQEFELGGVKLTFLDAQAFRDRLARGA
jgi:hypothetical protein